MGGELTQAQRNALKWLREQGGDGIFDKNGILVAAGEPGCFMRSTWNVLAERGLVEFYKPTGKGRGRCRVVQR